MSKVLITGVAGFIGMHTAIRFLREGWEVVGIDNMNSYYSIELKIERIKQINTVSYESKMDFTFFEEDITSDIWNNLESDISLIIHLAAQAGVRYSLENPNAYLHSNIFGFQKVLEFAEKRKLRLVYASSSSVYGKESREPFSESESCNSPESYYAATKKANEMMAFAYNKTHSLESVGLRFFTVYGPWGRPDMAPFIFTKAAYEGSKVKVFNFGNQQRDFTYIDDIVEGIFKISVSNEPFGASVFNIGNGEPTKLGEFIELIEKLTKKKLNKEYVDAQLGDVQSTYCDLQKMQSITGYKPQIKIEDGLRSFIKWYELNILRLK